MMDSFYDKAKKPTSLLSFLEAKKIDKIRLKHFFIENYSNIPQELRLVLWKICLGVSGSFQSEYTTSDKVLKDQYDYLKRILEEVIQINNKNPLEFNFCIYLLDKESLPLNETDLNTSHPFFFIYKQMTEILDDQEDFETYYLSVELYDYLKANFNNMKKKFQAAITNETQNKTIIEQLNVDLLLLNGLAGLFKDEKMYHIIWDRVVMGECDLLVFMLMSFLENCKEEHLKLFRNFQYSNLKQIQKIGLDESKVLKKATKYYKNLHPVNPSITNLIHNYFNTK